MNDTPGRDMAERAEPTKARPHGDCSVEWGNCGTKPVHWGAPTDTPHRCVHPATHIRRGLAKLHVCETCNIIGGRIVPSPYSKAGAQLREATLAHYAALKADRLAAKRALKAAQ